MTSLPHIANDKKGGILCRPTNYYKQIKSFIGEFDLIYILRSRTPYKKCYTSNTKALKVNPIQTGGGGAFEARANVEDV